VADQTKGAQLISALSPLQAKRDFLFLSVYMCLGAKKPSSGDRFTMAGDH